MRVIEGPGRLCQSDLPPTFIIPQLKKSLPERQRVKAYSAGVFLLGLGLRQKARSEVGGIVAVDHQNF